MNFKWYYLSATALMLLVISPPAFPIAFDTATNYDVGNIASAVVAADFDGDGDLDLAVVSGDSVAILKNNGDGTFAPKVSYKTDGPAYAVVASDLDGDGDFDLAVANNLLYSISILKNNGDGTFAEKSDYRTGIFPCSIVASDLDGDGDFDLAVANLIARDSTEYGISVFKNNGDGTFASKANYGAYYGNWAVTAADLDADGDVDLATSEATFKNNGDGTFGPRIPVPGLVNVAAVFASDLDGDDDFDLAAANCCDRGVSILKNDGNGTFTNDTSYLTGFYLNSVTGADFDGDGDIDLVVANRAFIVNNPCSTVSVFENAGDGTFAPKVDYTVGRWPISVFSADFDGDGNFDLAVANNEGRSVSVMKNLSNVPVCASVKGDLNADGQLSVLDVVFILNCVFLGYGTCNPCLADVNCDGFQTSIDVVLELNKIFLGMPFPCP